MKMTKKIMLGMAAALVAFSFVGCGGLGSGGSTLKNDDPKGAIKGSGSKYTVDFANDEDSVYRAYKATTFKHAGGLIKVTFDSADVSKSKMGVIFDLKANATDKDAKDFFIIGLNPRSDVANFYVSKFSNVTDMCADNFGTKLTSNPATEIEYVKLGTENITVPAAAEDGSISFYVYYKLNTNGSYEWKVLSMTDDKMKDFNSDGKFDNADFSDCEILKEGIIPDVYPAAEEGKESTYYNDSKDADGNKITKQNLIGYYAQIQPKTSLSGSWYVPSTTFHEAEDAE
ncbi:MAG: hypothetical protein K6A43_00925 [Treponema sp.]|nr:hypothetical protein [Treponema sp.]